MKMRRPDYLAAARVPATLAPQSFGLWTIERITAPPGTPESQALWKLYVGASSQTLLRRVTDATVHVGGEIVMEDSVSELERHLPIWIAARGRVLVTGLGLGCVLRGLLAKPDVEHVDVVEIDAAIIRVVGAEFAGNPRCTIHHADALTWIPPAGAVWDFAWHDLWTEGERHLQLLHGDLIRKFVDAVPVRRQGAWRFPRCAGSRIGVLGAPRRRRAEARP